ncbi:membrane-associated HD superfamily phosphohydrolase [Alkalibacillus filiformis]|uniref:Membrane-associated HD superfamily phosphohydrolase n=1 Tax=Alkalibacillus filiformis TaxID=200990 RepID=A0ABU0DV69_9BACI|nr:hypothetical protein [Alkalibacillus filiformis]MDQ0352045.1 membrane-associated HD superfamily phosphohydrolase [Alkalibacillus filiformis]
MELISNVWTSMIVVGIILFLILVIVDRVRGKSTSRATRELQTSSFFTFVMLVTSVLAVIEMGFTYLFYISLLFSAAGVGMIMLAVRKLNKGSHKEGA